MTEVVEIKPKWAGSVDLLLTALEIGTDKGKLIAMEDLNTMARLADAANAMAVALRSIIERSENGELGTSKVQDMKKMALGALKEAGYV